MKCIQFAAPGEPAAVLRCVETERPEPRRGEVLVRMLASPVNPSDLMFVRGRYTVAARCPATPGFEGVGVVEQSGGGLRGALFRGRRVVVLNGVGGNWAEYACVPADQVIPVGGQLSDEQAATFFVNPATAWVMTQEVLRVPRQAWLVQTAAASALGRMIVRLGRHCGFRTFNLVRNPARVDELRALGADHVMVFDGATNDVAQLQAELHRVTGSSEIQQAIDAVGGATGTALVQCLGQRGRLLVYGTLSNQPLSFSPRTLMTVGSSVEGFWLGNYMRSVSLPFKLRLIRRLTRLIQQGVLASRVRQSCSLEQIAEAVSMAEDSTLDGKVLLKMAGSGV